jgi:hypothetical protein
MDLDGLENRVQATLDHLEKCKETSLKRRDADMQDQLDAIFAATTLMMEIAEKYGLDVFTTLPYDG